MPVVTHAELVGTDISIDFAMPGDRIFKAFARNKTEKNGGLNLDRMIPVYHALLARAGLPPHDLDRAQLIKAVSVRRFATDNHLKSSAEMCYTVTISSMNIGAYVPAPESYLVSRSSCTCPDFRFRPEGARGEGDLCKHQVEAITRGLI